jgi:hypothetical protein
MWLIETAAVAGSLNQPTGDTPMKKIALSLIALAALSSASIAAGNNGVGSNQDTSKGYIDRHFDTPGTSNVIMTDVAPFAVESSAGLTAYERILKQSRESELGDR